MSSSPHSNQQQRGDLSRSSSASKAMRNMGINPGVQAKLMAFQAKRQQQMQQSKHQSSSESISSSNAQNNSDSDNTAHNTSSNSDSSKMNLNESDEDDSPAYSPLHSKVNHLLNAGQASSNFSTAPTTDPSTNTNTKSPCTPISLSSSTFSSPGMSPNDDMDALSRRTSFRLNSNNNNNNNSNNSNDGSILRRTSFRLNKNNSINSNSTLSDESEEDLSKSQQVHSSNVSTVYPVNKNLNYLSKIQKIQSSVQNSSSGNSKPPLKSLPSLPNSSSESDTTIRGNSSPSDPASPPLFSPHFLQPRNSLIDSTPANTIPNTNINTNTSVTPQPKGKLSLSQRRGLKLNLNEMNNGSSSDSASTASLNPMQDLSTKNARTSLKPLTNQSQQTNLTSLSSSSSSTLSSSRLQNNGISGLQNRMSKMTLNNMREGSLPARRNQMKLNLNGLPNANPMIKQNLSNARGPTPQMHLPHAASAPASASASNLNNSFAPFAKFIDVKSGSLNFSGKASLHSKGVDFENGSSFRISMDDLEVLEELGHGNYGVVSKVLHKPTGIIMAMKEVRLELDDDKFRQILMELEVLHSCNSDCIIEFYGAFFVEGAVYMCIEFMKGGSLDKIYGDGIPEIALAYITKRVVLGLKQLKDEHNIIHRDVKPTNMLVNENGKVKLCDFGVSGNLVASLARTNIGCQSYMAPERIKHANPDVSTYTVQSDIWSLGLSILEISKGSYPYPPETYNNVFSQLSAIVDGEPPKLPTGKFSLEAQDFVAQCLNKNPNNRPNYGELLKHPWLHMYSDAEGEDMLKDIVGAEIQRRETGKNDIRISKSVPALHSGLQR